MLNLDIKYSVENEVSRVQDAVNRIIFFKEKGYKVSLPKKISPESYNLGDNFITESVRDEYDDSVYKNDKKYILDSLEIINHVLNNFFESTHIKSRDSYEIFLTRYGVGGSYYPPNKVIINTKFRTGIYIVKSIIHEIIHLSVHDFVEKYNIDHWEKERFVDLIFEKMSPELNDMQKISIDTKKIDETFEKYYPDIEKIISNIKN